MFSLRAFAFALLSLSAIAFIAAPTVASASGGVFNGGTKVSCKSGAKVKNVKQCKENGGKR
jgi:hypothetical protein